MKILTLAAHLIVVLAVTISSSDVLASEPGQLYGLAELFSIDPSTGTMTPLFAAGSSASENFITAFDPVTKRLFFLSDLGLHVVNVATGAVSHASLGGRLPLLEFDPMTNTLYGLADLSGQ